MDLRENVGIDVVGGNTMVLEGEFCCRVVGDVEL